VHFGDGFGNLRAAPQQIEAAYPERGEFTEANAAVGEKEDGDAVVAGGVGELVDLVHREEDSLAFGGSREGNVVGGVARQATVPARQ